MRCLHEHTFPDAIRHAAARRIVCYNPKAAGAIAIESISHRTRLAELSPDTGEWLLALIGTVVQRPKAGEGRLPYRQRREDLEGLLERTGLNYGTGCADPAVQHAPDAQPATRAFAHFVAGLVRVCARAGTVAGGPFFQPDGGGAPAHEAARARRAQIVSVLAAVSDEVKAAVPVFRDPLTATDSAIEKLAGKVATRLSRRFHSHGGPFAGLPLLHGLCAIEARACATLALASFAHGRISPNGTAVVERAALAWRTVLVEVLADLSAVQARGAVARKSMDQVLRTQRLPAREGRQLRRALADPRAIEDVCSSLRGERLRRFVIEQILLSALVDGHMDAGEVEFIERVARGLELDTDELAAVETAVAAFYDHNQDALAALRLAELPEGLPHALTTRVQAAVVDNLDRVITEIKETGELAELLAKAAGGATLSGEEKTKVREQLVDLAKTIPALAIFAAPGGGILLPILIKLLPFNVLPSSFVDPPRRASARALPPPALAELKRETAS